MKHYITWQAGVCIVAGGLLTLSLAPFNIWPLAIIALALFHFVLGRQPQKPLWLSFCFSGSLFLTGCYWVFVSIHYYGNTPTPLAAIMTLAFCLGIGALLLPFIYFYQRFLQTSWLGKTFGFAAIWVLVEWFRSWFLTGFPWAYAGYSQTEGPLAALAPIISVYGLSFIIALTAASIATIKQRPSQISLALLIAVFLISPTLFNIQWSKPTGKRQTVALLQPNVNLHEKWQPQNREKIITQLESLSAKAKHADLVIWPETSVPWPYPASNKRLTSIRENAKNQGQAIILGIPSRFYKPEQTVLHNSMLALGTASGIYHKQKLVPFGEYLPFESLLRGLIDFFNLPMSSFNKGPKAQQGFQYQGLDVHPYICYEVVYPNFVANTAGQSELLLTVSNDAWFGRSIGPLQHLQMAQMRALENAKPMLRSTNNGVTALINHQGQIQQRLQQFEQGLLIGEVYPRKGLTPVSQYGTLPAIIFSLLCVIILTALSLNNRRKP